MEDPNSSSTSSNEACNDYEVQPKVKRKKRKDDIQSLPKDYNKYYYYGPDNCHRKRYHFCGDCPYKTIKPSHLLSHIKNSHPSSKTALPPPKIKPPKPAKIPKKKGGLKPPPNRPRAGTILRCSKCEYKTIRSNHMKWHEERHERKTGHLCPLCSYSLKQKLDIYLHIKKHHSGSERDRILSERKDVDHQLENNQGDIEEEDDPEEWLYFANGTRTKYIYCGDCDFKSNRYNVETHARRMHPNSTTAMPPPPPQKPEKVLLKCPHCDYSTISKKHFERHELHHRKKFAHQCSFCSFSLDSWNHIVRHAKLYHSNNVIIHQKREDRRKEISSLKEKEEWYYRQDGKRIRYQFCSDCDYKSTKRVHLEKHVKTMHPNSNTALPPAPPKRGQTLYQCTLCQCKTPSKQYFDDHLMHHRKKFAHRCHLCSYTSKGRAWLDRHLKNHHHRRRESGSKNFPLFQCSECEYSTGHVTNMKMHEERHNRDEEFKCSRCNYSAEHEYLVTQHLHRNHRSALSSENSRKAIVINNRTLEIKRSNPDGKEVAIDIANRRDPNNNRLLKCSLCLYTTNHTGNMMTHEEAHNRSQKYKCNRCSFSSNYKGIVKVHTKRYHPSPREEDSDDDPEMRVEDSLSNDEVETHQTSCIRNDDTPLFKCSLCGFSSLLSTYMKAHEYGHERNGEFKCSLCSFSSYFQATIDIHLQDCHTLKERMKVKATTRTTSNLSSSRKSQVTLDRFFERATTSSNKVKIEEEEEATRCNVQLLRLNKEQEAKLLDLQSRIQVMQKKVITAQKELEEASTKKRNVFDKIKEIAAKKVKIEYDLRAQQCEALELNIMSLNDEAGQNDVVLAEYSAMCLEDEMKMFEDELQGLREQDAILIKDVEVAEGSFIGVNQVLLALMSELDSLVHGC